MRLFFHNLCNNTFNSLCSLLRFSFSAAAAKHELKQQQQQRRKPRTTAAMSAGDAITSSPSSPPITLQQRQRMELNRNQARAKQLWRQDRLTDQQKLILEAVAAGRSVFITGSGGTGKTFLLHRIVRLLREIHPPGSVFVTASTGVAACALDAQTLHSFAGIGLGAADADRLVAKVASDKPSSRRWRSACALVIDEVSMVDGELFDKLDLIARRLRCPASASDAAPWGGIQLVVSGDFFQLPPVKPPNKEKEFAFEADCWPRCFDLQVELTHVFRQSDSSLVELLQGIRRGCPDHDLLHLLDRRCVDNGQGQQSSVDSKAALLFPRNEDVRRVNNERLRSLGEKITTYQATDSGSEPWKSQLGLGIAPEELELCRGARVMLIKNTDLKSGLVNGATGVVLGFNFKEGSAPAAAALPMVKFDCGVEKLVEPETWDVMEGDQVRATRRQIPLILAWAVSVHKCQGMTLDCIHTDLSRAFGCGMVYVALSRVRTLDGLHLSGFNPAKIKAHPKVFGFYNHLFQQM